MERLVERDLRSLADLGDQLAGVDGIAALRVAALAAVRRLIDNEIASYNEVGTTEETHSVLDPIEMLHANPLVNDGFAEFAHQNPLVVRSQRSGNSETLRLSDFISSSRLRRTDLYEHVYRPLEVEFQVAMTLPSTTRVIGIAVNRRSPDFTDHEVALLDAARPIIASSYRAVSEAERLQSALRALERPSDTPQAVFFVDDDGQIDPMNSLAIEMARHAQEGDDEPTRFLAWVEVMRSGAVEPAHTRFGDGYGAFEARYVRSPGLQPDVVVVSSPSPEPNPNLLRALGLTYRQAAVLDQVWRGKSNVQISRDLFISAHTVHHHLEHIYQRIGVTSRVAAARVAASVYEAHRWP